MRYRAAAVVLALAAAVAIGQVPMYSDYPWGLLNNGTDQGPVWNLDCKPPLWCSVPTYGNGQVQLGDGGVLPITVLFAQDAGQALLAGFAAYAADAGLANRSSRADFADDAGFALFAADAGRSYLANFSDFAADAGYSQSSALAGVATYALDAGLASKANVADFARDAGSAASADLATAALWAGDAGLSVAALWAGDAGYSLNAAKAAAADFARDAGSAASADLSTYALDAGNVQCIGCIDTARLGANAVTTAKVADLAIGAAELDDGVPLAAYDEAQPAGVYARTTATNCTKNVYDGVAGFIRYTIGTATTNPQVSSTLYTGTSTTLATTRAVMRYRLSAGAANKVTAVTAINNADTAQTATAVFLADGNWHTAVFDISSWTTAGTLRVDLTLASNLSTTGNWDISYLGTGNPGSGTGSLVSYQGRVGIGAPTPAAPLEIAGAHVANRGLLSLTSSPSSIAALTLYPEGTYAGALYGNTDDSVWLGTAGATSLSLYTNGSGNPRIAVDSAGAVTVNKPSAGNSLTLTGTNGVVGALQSTSNTATSQTRLQLYHYGANGGSPVLETYAARGTSASPTSPNSGDVLGAWYGYGRTLVSFTEGSRVEMLTTAAAGTSTLTTAIDFYTSNAAASARKMRLDAAGYLGLGTTTIPAQVTVYGTGQTTGTFNTAGNLGGTVYVRDSGSSAGNGGALMFGANQGAFAVIKGLLSDGASNTKGDLEFSLRTNAADSTLTNRLKIFSNGDVRVNTLAGTGNRAVYSDANGTLTNTSSDGTLKEDVEDLRAPLRMVLNLRPVTFRWKNTARFGEQREMGFIAQEVMQAIPEVVGRNSDGTYTVDYPKIVAALAGAVQELYEDRTWLARRVQQLEDRAQQAEDRLAALEARVTKLEAWVAE